ncbi:MAG: hypothetical protein Q9168_006506, partial [Polycauliona sp. 1 TL-2023]
MDYMSMDGAIHTNLTHGGPIVNYTLSLQDGKDLVLRFNSGQQYFTDLPIYSTGATNVAFAVKSDSTDLTSTTLTLTNPYLFRGPAVDRDEDPRLSASNREAISGPVEHGEKPTARASASSDAKLSDVKARRSSAHSQFTSWGLPKSLPSCPDEPPVPKHYRFAHYTPAYAPAHASAYGPAHLPAYAPAVRDSLITPGSHSTQKKRRSTKEKHVGDMTSGESTRPGESIAKSPSFEANIAAFELAQGSAKAAESTEALVPSGEKPSSSSNQEDLQPITKKTRKRPAESSVESSVAAKRVIHNNEGIFTELTKGVKNGPPIRDFTLPSSHQEHEELQKASGAAKKPTARPKEAKAKRTKAEKTAREAKALRGPKQPAVQTIGQKTSSHFEKVGPSDDTAEKMLQAAGTTRAVEDQLATRTSRLSTAAHSAAEEPRNASSHSEEATNATQDDNVKAAKAPPAAAAQAPAPTTQLPGPAAQ